MSVKSLLGDKQISKGSALCDKFIVPPFSVLDTRQGYWQSRKKSWVNIGIESELGRNDNIVIGPDMCNSNYQRTYDYSSVSIFDPVLCELMYTWFCPEKGKVLDPFAGGSVRGVVCSCLGRDYIGVDLCKEQLEANKAQLHNISKNKPILGHISWVNDNSLNLDNIVDDNSVDMVFSCPPYYNLEVYSEKEGDLSNCDTYEEFLKLYGEIIRLSCNKLKQDSFAVFVVSNIRDEKGFYHNLASDTINLFEINGVNLYNDIILMNVPGTLPMRITRQFNSGRKIGRMHQNVLVFYKGDPANIKDKFGKLGDTNVG